MVPCDRIHPRASRGRDQQTLSFHSTVLRHETCLHPKGYRFTLDTSRVQGMTWQDIVGAG